MVEMLDHRDRARPGGRSVEGAAGDLVAREGFEVGEAAAEAIEDGEGFHGAGVGIALAGAEVPGRLAMSQRRPSAAVKAVPKLALWVKAPHPPKATVTLPKKVVLMAGVKVVRESYQLWASA